MQPFYDREPTKLELAAVLIVLPVYFVIAIAWWIGVGIVTAGKGWASLLTARIRD